MIIKEKKIKLLKINVIILLIIYLELIFNDKRKTKKETKICLCVIAKNENIYAREYV